MTDIEDNPTYKYLVLCEEVVINLEAKHTKLLIDIVSITDVVRQEQITEAYTELLDDMQLAKINLQNAESNYILFITGIWYEEYKQFHSRNFIKADPITCLEKTNNILIHDTLIKNRLRIPNKLDKRKLYLAVDIFDKKIDLLNLDSSWFDVIGKSDSSWILFTDGVDTYYHSYLDT
jgi:hypothetical protein